MYGLILWFLIMAQYMYTYLYIYIYDACNVSIVYKLCTTYKAWFKWTFLKSSRIPMSPRSFQYEVMLSRLWMMITGY